MNSEGKGIHAPAPLRMRLSRSDALFCGQHALARAEHRRYASGPRQWQRGLVGGVVIEGWGRLDGAAASICLGLLGEVALVYHINARCGVKLRVDDRLHDGDKGIDFRVRRMTIQVKARTVGSDADRRRVNLVRHSDERGRNKFPRTTALAFCAVEPSTLWVSLLGWVHPVRFANREPVKAVRGTHKNIEIPDCELQPIAELLDAINSHKEGDEWL